jgi:PAS domain S-box-containing protein
MGKAAGELYGSSPSEFGFGLLFDSIRDAVVVCDLRDQTIVMWNPAAEAMFGYSPDEAIGSSLDLLVPDHLKALHRAGLERVHAAGERTLLDVGQAVVLEALAKNGTKLWVEITLGSLGDRHVMELIRDVTARTLAEEELNRFFALSPDMLCVANFDGEFVKVNSAWEWTLGWTSQELSRAPFMDFVHPDDVERTTAAMADLLESRPVISFENRYRTKAGDYRWMQWNANPSVDRGLIFAVARDVTEQKRVQEELARHSDELARSNTALEQLSYVASHDLQEPLRMVASYVQLLERRYKGKLDADADEFIGYAVDGAKRMQELINDLLEYSRVGTKGKPFAPVPLEAVLTRALRNLEIAMEDAHAAVTHDALPEVCGDEGQLVQLFQNLIGNAVKFRGDRPPRIHVSASRDDDCNWAISISDNGIGIDPQYVDRIFTMFQRLHSRSEYEGTGIGLAICRRIVERHGGRIWVESQHGAGSTFTFTLPITEDC